MRALADVVHVPLSVCTAVSTGAMCEEEPKRPGPSRVAQFKRLSTSACQVVSCPQRCRSCHPQDSPKSAQPVSSCGSELFAVFALCSGNAYQAVVLRFEHQACKMQQQQPAPPPAPFVNAELMQRHMNGCVRLVGSMTNVDPNGGSVQLKTSDNQIVTVRFQFFTTLHLCKSFELLHVASS